MQGGNYHTRKTRGLRKQLGNFKSGLKNIRLKACPFGNKTIALFCKEEISIQEKQVDFENSMATLKACLFPSVSILRCRGPKKVN